MEAQRRKPTEEPFDITSGCSVARFSLAAVDEQVSKPARKSNPDNAACESTDSFEKVDGFYKDAGSEGAPHSRTINATMQYAVLNFRW